MKTPTANSLPSWEEAIARISFVPLATYRDLSSRPVDGIRAERRRNEMVSAVYLSHCKVFVTNDNGHRKATKAVAELAGIDTAVLACDEFRSGLFGLSTSKTPYNPVEGYSLKNA